MELSPKTGLSSLGIEDPDTINKVLQALVKKKDYTLAAAYLQQSPVMLDLTTRSMLADVLAAATKKPAHRPAASGRTKTDDRNDRIKAEIEKLVSEGMRREAAHEEVRGKYGLTVDAFAKARKGSGQARRLAKKLGILEKK